MLLWHILFSKNNETELITISMSPIFDIKNEIKIIEEISGVKYLEIRKLVISTYNSIQDYNPIYYIKHVPKPMFIYKILKLIDDNSSDLNC